MEKVKEENWSAYHALHLTVRGREPAWIERVARSEAAMFHDAHVGLEFRS
jgi:hypothetical protein